MKLDELPVFPQPSLRAVQRVEHILLHRPSVQEQSDLLITAALQSSFTARLISTDSFHMDSGMDADSREGIHVWFRTYASSRQNRVSGAAMQLSLGRGQRVESGYGRREHLPPGGFMEEGCEVDQVGSVEFDPSLLLHLPHEQDCGHCQSADVSRILPSERGTERERKGSTAHLSCRRSDKVASLVVQHASWQLQNGSTHWHSGLIHERHAHRLKGVTYDKTTLV